jgi:hypothetical protein
MLPLQKMKFVNVPSAAPQGVWRPINREQFERFAPDLRWAYVTLQDGILEVGPEGLTGWFTGRFKGKGQPVAQVQGQVRWAMAYESAFLTFSAPNGLQYFSIIYRCGDSEWGAVRPLGVGGPW